jgi:transglutaminase-like putative cysteine protease
MRIRIKHRTAYAYDEPVHSITELLRMTPRDHDGQRVGRWRIDLDQDGRLVENEDAFGNIVHVLSLHRPLDSLAITVEGEVETEDTVGVISGAIEPFPPGLYLRETALTRADAAIKEFAGDVMKDDKGLDGLHKLLLAVKGEMRFLNGPTDASTTAAQAFKGRTGVCQDLSHVFIGAARSRGIPARYVGGYLLREDGMVMQTAGHAWTEVHVPGLGWVGFDPANGISPTAAHVRVAMGLDYLGAAPVRGSRTGGSEERLEVSVAVDQAGKQQQS